MHIYISDSTGHHVSWWLAPWESRRHDHQLYLAPGEAHCSISGNFSRTAHMDACRAQLPGPGGRHYSIATRPPSSI